MILPDYIIKIINKIEKLGYEAFPVGGCIRDLLAGKEPDDWDVVTDAPLEYLKDKWEKGFTVGYDKKTLSFFQNNKRIDISMLKGKNINEDLLYRDFTMNSIAYDTNKKEIIDPNNGIKDYKEGLIKAVTNPYERFKEDYLRMLRAVRFSACLDMTIEEKTSRSIIEMASKIKEIPQERIKYELNQILLSDKVEKGIMLLKDTRLLEHIIPELSKGIGMEQRGAHLYDVFEHSVKATSYVKKDLITRWAALLHDVGKPSTLKILNNNRCFPNHDIEGENISKNILKRLKLPNNIVKEAALIVGTHLFIYNENTEDYTVRKLIKTFGEKGIFRLIDLMYADRKAINPVMNLLYVKMFEKRVKKILNNEGLESFESLEISGDEIMEAMNIKKGPEIGKVKKILEDYVLKNPLRNDKEILLEHLKTLKLDHNNLI